MVNPHVLGCCSKTTTGERVKTGCPVRTDTVIEQKSYQIAFIWATVCIRNHRQLALICSYFSQKSNCHFLVLFSNISTLPHFQLRRSKISVIRIQLFEMLCCGGWENIGLVYDWQPIYTDLQCHEVSEKIMNYNRISISLYLLEVLRGVFARCHSHGCVAATGTS